MWSDWLVVCECGFSLSALWCPLSVPIILLGFLLSWMWGISSWLLQQSTDTAPYLSCVAAPPGHRPSPWRWGSSSWPCLCATTAACAVKVLYTICQQIRKTQEWPQNWKRSVFILIPKKGNAKECSNYCTIALISHASKVMLKILQARLQQYMNHELPDVQASFEKAEDQRSNCQHPLDHQKSKRVQEKHLFLLYWLCQSLWLCVLQ